MGICKRVKKRLDDPHLSRRGKRRTARYHGLETPGTKGVQIEAHLAGRTQKQGYAALRLSLGMACGQTVGKLGGQRGAHKPRRPSRRDLEHKARQAGLEASGVLLRATTGGTLFW